MVSSFVTILWTIKVFLLSQIGLLSVMRALNFIVHKLEENVFNVKSGRLYFVVAAVARNLKDLRDISGTSNTNYYSFYY